MKEQAILETDKLTSRNNPFWRYNDVLGLAEIDSLSIDEVEKIGKPYSLSESNKIGLIWVTKGECTIVVDEVSYSLQKQNLFLIPSSEYLTFYSCSSDFEAKAFIAEKTFMDECVTNKQIISFFNYLLIKRVLQTKLTSSETDILNKNFNDIKDKIKATTHSFYNELVCTSFTSLLLELSHILNNVEENQVFRKFTRKEELFYRFINLLSDHYKEQHEVAFYAEKLFVTPQYLTLIIKKLTGKTTNKWIDESLILEARKLLKTTQTTIQQIADQLNFSDQSTFGKFFKKYHGVSPVEYRKLQYTPQAV
ncbi:AraC family transcriptional activator of pobA [Parabacteroides sp. PF5-5]|uniref:helix-turn-helix domain-containing protein n=1 Tax=unclassified Parabacteroides TaxID=2649774 RepID=UPI0024761BEC|nr:MULTISPECIES: AraC family transcriptional regulator [unclassified Parabacteroides]MDH6303972.1 AraC family transcriptional activator of pobA [Parabacteroides sp. PH5-39]MDH6314588.1 AraC family transcriptional activator of pobA [Parabacteroides sp. PF5-13]MDH6318347.1 AraC family transcriptional activator of pobA [Parabacteroides sp. PH5-13]MDH6322361.1 AraC family transcriptional activator of pobA [Parabacteroides sp. PH5-8]MDH6325560.1 AraC family transcriptional activator of pobA [Paraba